VFLALMALAMMTLLGRSSPTWSSAPAWRATASA
jgi:hypothetical protein